MDHFNLMTLFSLFSFNFRNGGNHERVFQRYNNGILHHFDCMDCRSIWCHLLYNTNHQATLAKVNCIFNRMFSNCHNNFFKPKTLFNITFDTMLAQISMLIAKKVCDDNDNNNNANMLYVVLFVSNISFKHNLYNLISSFCVLR